MSFKNNRAEWILGFSCCNTHNATEGTLHRFGTSVCNNIQEETYSYLSPIDLKQQHDSLLTLLWKYRGKMDFYVINCLNILLEIIVENQFLSEYVFNLDPPTYQYARFTDWFRPYLNKRIKEIKRNMQYRHSTKKQECVIKCFAYLEVYEKALKQYERKLQGLPIEEEKSTAATETTTDASKEGEKKVTFEKPQEQNINTLIEQEEAKQEEEDKIIECYPKKYIIGCTRECKEIYREEKDGVTVTLEKVYTEYAESQPTLNGNKTLPSYAFSNSKTDMEEYERRHYQHEPEREIIDIRGENVREIIQDDDEQWNVDNQMGGTGSEEDTNEARRDPPTIFVNRAEDDITDVKGAVSSVQVKTKTQEQPQDPDTQDATTDPQEEDKKNESDWFLPKKVGDVIIVALVKNTTDKHFDLKMKFCLDDETAQTNIRSPINSIDSTVTPNYFDMWLCVNKINPEKDWGEFHVEWEVEETVPVVRHYQHNVMYHHQPAYDDDDYNHGTVYGPANIQVQFYGV
jgi:hypothetical protein